MSASKRVQAAGLSLALLAGGGGVSAAGVAEQVKFAPHRAVYDVTLARATPGSGVNEMTGRLVYELRGGGCEDYFQTMRFVTQSSGAEGGDQINDMRTASSEEAQGRRLQFSNKQYRGDQLSEITEGEAGRRNVTGEVAIEIVQPEKRKLVLPAATYFPIQHSRAMIEAALAGKRLFAADVYDGSETGDKVSATMTVIGRMHAADASAVPAGVPNADRLAKLRFWPISTGYFQKGGGADKKDSMPNYEMAANFYENGVSTRLLMDYGDFALRGELKELQFLGEPACVTPAGPAATPGR